MFALLLSLVATIFSIISLQTSITKTPIILITNDDAISVTDIYFPAVSFCATIRMSFHYSTHNIDLIEIDGKLKSGNITVNDLSEHE